MLKSLSSPHRHHECSVKQQRQQQHHHDAAATPTRSSSVGPMQQCTGCGALIADRFLLQVNGLAWHAKCLQCISCSAPLDAEALCYVRNSQVYCRNDYYRLFGTKCSKCTRWICPTDWVRKARAQVYHLACFACDACKRQLSTGEEFALADDKVLCKTHFQELFDCATPSERDKTSSNEDSCDGGESSSEHRSSSSSKSKTKRVRTTFTDEQLQVLQANFQIDSNPDGQDLERIAQITGLSKRVTQVWFQNSRARQKKHMQKQKRKQWSSPQPSSSGTPPSSGVQQQHSSSSPSGLVAHHAPPPPPPPPQHHQHHHHIHHHQQQQQQHNNPHDPSRFEKTSAASQLSEDEPAASPLTMLYSF